MSQAEFIRHCQETKYPDIYKVCYWNSFPIEQLREDAEEIMKNRNDFVQAWKIKKRAESVPKYVYVQSEIYKRPGEDHAKIAFGDHPEFYKIKDGHIVIVSPYSPLITDGIREFKHYDEEAIEKGYTKIPQMYLKAAETYMKVIYNKKK